MSTMDYFHGFRAGLDDANNNAKAMTRCPHPALSAEWNDWMEGHVQGVLTIFYFIELGRRERENKNGERP